MPLVQQHIEAFWKKRIGPLCYKEQLEVTILTLNKFVVLSHHTGVYHYVRDLINGKFFALLCTILKVLLAEDCYGNQT